MTSAPERGKLEKRLLANLTVLVVDDDASIVSLIRSVLQGIGVGATLTTTSGEVAVQLFVENRDAAIIVLCDWNMPGMSGLEILRALRSIDPQVCFAMITGTAESSLVLEAKNSGVNAYIVKPFSAEAIRKKLLVLAKVQAHRANQAFIDGFLEEISGGR